MPEAGPRPRLPVCVRTCTSKRFGKPTLVGQGQAGASGGKLQKNIESTVNLAPQFAERKCSKKNHFFCHCERPRFNLGSVAIYFYLSLRSCNLREWQSPSICHCEGWLCQPVAICKRDCFVVPQVAGLLAMTYRLSLQARQGVAISQFAE